MHTFEGKTIRIIHHGDCQGYCVLINKATDENMEIDSEDLLAYVAEYIRSERIQKIESMTVKDLLK